VTGSRNLSPRYLPTKPTIVYIVRFLNKLLSNLFTLRPSPRHYALRLLTIHTINSNAAACNAGRLARSTRETILRRGRGRKFERFVLPSHTKKESLRDDSLEQPGAKAAPRVYKLILRWIKTRNTSEREIHLTFAPASQDKLLFEGREGHLSKARHYPKFGGDRVPLRKIRRDLPRESPCFGFVGWWTPSVTVNRDPTMRARGWTRYREYAQPKIHRGRISQRRLQYASGPVSCVFLSLSPYIQRYIYLLYASRRYWVFALLRKTSSCQTLYNIVSIASRKRSPDLVKRQPRYFLYWISLSNLSRGNNIR